MSSPTSPEPLRFLTSERQPDGTHTSPALSRAVERGELLRLRRGIYLPAQQWRSASPWHRYLIAVSAHAQACPEEILSGESSLALHGIPQLRVPQKIFALCRAPNRAGTRTPPPMTAKTFSQDRTLRQIPVKRMEAALKRGQSRPEFRAELRAGVAELPSARLTAPPVPWLPAPESGFLTEPLPHSLITSVPRMSFAAAVVVLDAAKRGEHSWNRGLSDDDLVPHLDLLRSRRTQIVFDTAWRFSDPRAESPGESWSRALIHELGFYPPALQERFVLPTGRHVRVDFWWEGVGVVGEFDGLMKYRKSSGLAGESAEETIIQEKLREDGLRSLGPRVIRWTWADLREPERLRRLLLGAGVPLRQETSAQLSPPCSLIPP